MNNFKLTKSEYLSLWGEKISKKEYDQILVKINERFQYIMKTICTKLSWWDYDNGWEETSVYFQPNKYHADEDSYINFDGEYTMPSSYNSCPDIPIKWLWTDFEEEFKKEVEDEKVRRVQEKEKLKEKRADAKIKKHTIKEIILSKLTKEELKFIKFK